LAESPPARRPGGLNGRVDEAFFGPQPDAELNASEPA
jgi:hypothetical protein